MIGKFQGFACTQCSSWENSLLSQLQQEDLEQITNAKHCIRYKKGQTLFFEGTRPIGIFCIHAGHVKVTKSSSSGKEQIIYLANPGDIIGYQALLSEEEYSTSATVLDESVICFIPKEDFLDILMRDNQLTKKLMKETCRQLGMIEEKIATISMLSVRERLASCLLMLKETYGLEGTNSSSIIEIALSREDLANLIGTATETVIRLLSEFKNDGLIEFIGKKIKVSNPQALAKVADFYS